MTGDGGDGRSLPVERDSHVLGGLPVFAGTHVPVRALHEMLAAGDTLDDFLAAFPDVRREDALAVIEAGEDPDVRRGR